MRNLPDHGYPHRRWHACMQQQLLPHTGLPQVHMHACSSSSCRIMVCPQCVMHATRGSQRGRSCLSTRSMQTSMHPGQAGASAHTEPAHMCTGFWDLLHGGADVLAPQDACDALEGAEALGGHLEGVFQEAGGGSGAAGARKCHPGHHVHPCARTQQPEASSAMGLAPAPAIGGERLICIEAQA